ncbi:MAG: phosphotransferase family protein, partial [Pseudonocardiaceae bacterium]
MGASPQRRRPPSTSTAELQAPAPGTTAAAAGKLPTARAVLAAACTTAGLDHTGARLIRFVGNAVFHLAHHPVVVKITLSTRLWRRAGNALAAARVLAAHRVPAVRPTAHPARPVYVGPYPVTFWQQIHDDGPPPTMADLAGLLTQLHHIPLPHLPVAGLPGWDPVPDLRRRIAAAQDTDPDQLHFLRERCDEAAEKLAGLRYRLPRAVIHGDARLGNLIASPQGPVLCDLDTTSIGPPEWDLVPAAVAAL